LGRWNWKKRCRVKPRIDKTRFGSITIEGTVFKHDVIIRLSGRVKKRKKKLSKVVYGTSHTISLDEAKHVYEEGAERLIVGTGQFGRVTLSDEAADYFKRKKCQVELLSTRKAIRAWNAAGGAVRTGGRDGDEVCKVVESPGDRVNVSVRKVHFG
jgi:hypothetical protein